MRLNLTTLIVYASLVATVGAVECPRQFSPLDVVEFLKVTEDSDTALAARD